MRNLKALPLALLMAWGVMPASAADTPASRQLVDQALYWQAKGQDARAAEAWQKLLRVQPNHGQALAALGLIAVREGRLDDAANYYDQANLQPAPVTGLLTLKNALTSAGQQGRAAQPAMPRGNRVLDTSPGASIAPAPVVAGKEPWRESYESLAGTSEGWASARNSLEKLAQANPNDAHYRIALARVLTYRQSTRREGIRQLAAWSAQQPDSQELRESWRQGLTWLGSDPADRGLVLAYLARYPDDEAMRARLDAMDQRIGSRRIDPQAVARQAGFSALQQGDGSAAEAAFRKVLSARPQDADALGGLGVLFLRREDFEEAARLLDQAMASNPGKWRQARNSAHYWLAMQAARDAQRQGLSELAERTVRQAISLDSHEPSGQVLLAELLRERGDNAGAEALYRQLLLATPNQAEALRGLIALLAESGREAEALRLVQSLNQQQAQASGALGNLRSAIELRQAQALEAMKDYSGAAKALENALLLDPGNRSVRLALARQYQQLGNSAAAMALLGDSLQTDSAWPEGRLTQAQALAREQRWQEALQALERIPSTQRTDAMAAEQQRFWIHAQAQRALAFAGNGDNQQAWRLLSEAQAAAADTPDGIGVIASAWADVGQLGRALALLRDAIGAAKTPPVGLRIHYAGLLLRAGQEAELALVLPDIAGRPLTADEEKSVNRIIVAYTLRMVDGLREQGRLAQAYDALMPTLQASDDTGLWLALARLHSSAGDHAQALEIAERIIRTEPDNVEHRLFAAGVAIAANALDKAAGHADAALALAPDHPRVLAMAGRVEKARGHMANAVRYFQYAMALEREQAAFSGMPGNLSLHLIDPDSDDGSGDLPAASPSAPGGLLPIPGAPRPQLGQAEPAPLSQNRTATARFPPSLGANLLPLQAPPPIGTNAAADRASLSYASTSTPTPAVSRSASVLANNRPVLASPPSLNDELQALQSQLSTTLTTGVGFRSRTGRAGLAQLDESELPLEAKLPFQDGESLTVRVSHIELDAGNLDTSSPQQIVTFGSNAEGSFLVPGSLRIPNQDASGTALSLIYQDSALTLDLGVTPLGFVLPRIVGGARYTGQVGDAHYYAGLSRRAVTDSVLSYAGTRDPVTQQAWGAVTRFGGYLGATLGDGDLGVYGELGHYRLSGKFVPVNSQSELNLGGYLALWQTPDAKLSAGINLNVLSSADNLSQFTFGHGGYFSPQLFASVALPITLAGQRNALSYELGTEVSVRQIRQESALYFPEDPLQQARWQQRVLDLQLDGFATRYAATQESGLGFGFKGKFEYKLWPDLALGGTMSYEDSRGYSQYAALLYLRYGLGGLPQTPRFPPQPLRPLFLGVPE